MYTVYKEMSKLHKNPELFTICELKKQKDNLQAFLTIFKWIILNRWIHKHLIWSCNLRDFNFKRYKQPFSGLYTSANSDLHTMTKRIPFLQQNFSSTLWNVYFLTFVVLNFKLYSLIFHFIKVSCTRTTSLLKCKIHSIHFQISSHSYFGLSRI